MQHKILRNRVKTQKRGDVVINFANAQMPLL